MMMMMLLLSPLIYTFIGTIIYQVLDSKVQSKYVNATRWFMTCVNQPEFVDVLGSVTLATAEQTTPNAPGAAAAPSAGGAKPKYSKDNPAPKGEGNNQKKEKKKQEPKKAAAPKKEVVPEVLPEDMEMAAEPEGFYQDGWKKMFSNNTPEVYKAWFWEKIVKDDKFSVWQCSAQDADKYLCQPLWMTTNQVNGFIQRAEPARKYAFGIVGTFGTESQQEVEGLWIWAGQDYLKQMGDCADAEYYDWKKLDLKADKDTINKYLDYPATIKDGNFGPSKFGFAELRPVVGADSINVFQ